MTFRECVDFANKNPLCYVATVEGDQPRVRPLLMWHAKEDGFYFCGLAPKKVWQQLKANPQMEACFCNNAPEFKDVASMRVSGRAEFLDDIELKKQVLEDRKMYASYGSGKPEDPCYPVVRVTHGEVWTWTPKSILKESEAERIRF